MSSHMLTKQGRTFTMATYVIAAAFVLVVFAIEMVVRHIDAQDAILKLVGNFVEIAIVGLSALGIRATVAEAKKTVNDAPASGSPP